MTANPYVVAPTGPSATSGTYVIDDVVSLAGDIRNGNWLAAGMDALATGLDAVATYSDPLGTALAAGIGFILDHLEPLKGWLNDLTGDPGQVAANAGTYAKVASALSTEGSLLSSSVTNDLADESGQAIDAYRAHMSQQVRILDALSHGAGATSTALQIASTLVQTVHDLVRDAISQIVGSAISYAAELVFTLGAATPLVIEQVSSRVAEIAGRIGKDVRGVVSSVGNLKNLVKRLEEAIQGLRKLLRDLKPHGKGPKKPPKKSTPKTPSGTRAPERVTLPDGTDVPGVPSGATPAGPAKNGKGWIYNLPPGQQGISDKVTQVRVMDPKTTGPHQYPNGYVNYLNKSGQAVDPVTGKTLGKSDPLWHIPL